MTEQGFIEELFFRKCQNWNTDTYPNLHNGHMQLSIANSPHWIMLNDQTVNILAEMCRGCLEFRQE